MAVAVQMQIRGEDKIARMLGQLHRRMGDLSPLMERIGSVLEESVLHRFETTTGPDGARWSPSIRAREKGGKTLTDSGRLKLSINYRASSSSVAVGTNVIYAAIHQFGGTIRPKSAKRLTFRLPGGLGVRSVAQVIMPGRPFLGFDADDREEIEAQVEDYVAETGALA